MENLKDLYEKKIEKINTKDLYEKSLSGEYLYAFTVSFENFLQIDDLGQSQKDLKNYKIFIDEFENYYVITYLPILLSDEQAKKYKAITLGREIRYWINKKDNKIEKRLFYK
jgi:hypothetical protein